MPQNSYLNVSVAASGRSHEVAVSLALFFLDFSWQKNCCNFQSLKVCHSIIRNHSFERMKNTNEIYRKISRTTNEYGFCWMMNWKTNILQFQQFSKKYRKLKIQKIAWFSANLTVDIRIWSALFKLCVADEAFR